MASILLITGLSGCSGMSYGAKYSISDTPEENSNMYYSTFSSDLCVVNSDINESGIEISENASGGLFDLTNKETLYARNVNMQVHPASLTTVMTAFGALKYGSLDQVLVAGSDV